MLKHSPAIALVLGLLLISPQALADGGGGGGGSGGGGIGPPGVDAWIGVTVVGSDGGTGHGTGGRYQVRVEPSIQICRFKPVEWLSYVYLYDASTVKNVQYLGSVCPGPGNTVVAAALLPTAADIFRLRPIPVPRIGLSPGGKGLTGLETWGWYEGSQTVTVTVFLRGYQVTAVAHPVSYEWSFGDGATEMTSAPGSGSSPAAKNVYQAKGEYTVTLSATWSGSYTFTGHGVSGGGQLGSVTVSNTTSYPVVEVRSVLVG